MKERVGFVKEYISKSPYFFNSPLEYDQSIIQKRWKEDSAELLKRYNEKINSLSPAFKEEYENVLKQVASEANVKIGYLIHPLRLAVSGTGEGPGVFDIVDILGKDETIKRINTAIEKIHTIN
jgi:glutamyl-tRNA synthetase